MTANGIDRLGHGLRGLAAGCVGLAVLGLACANAPAAPEEAAAPAPMALQEVRVANEASATVVELLGVHDPEYVDFRQERPARIVLDLANVGRGPVSDSVAVYDGTVEEISLAETPVEGGGVRTRIELALARPASYQVVALEDRLALRVTPDEASPAAPAAAAPASAPAAAPARALAQVSAEKQAGGTLVRLVADGEIRAPQQFPLSDPERLVIDLPGIQSRAPAKVEVGSSQVKRVRVGAHDGKVRVVIDGAGPGSLAGARLATTADGLAVAFGDATLPAASAAAPAAAAAAASAPAASAQVMGVQFDAQAERERVAILTSSAAAYHVMAPDDQTFVVSFPDASIDPDAAIRVAPEKPGSVSLVTAFQQPDAAPAEVRVVVRRAKGLTPDVHREGDMLFLDFERTGDVAAGLPMLGADAASAEKMATETPAAAGEQAPAALGDMTGDEAIGMLKEGGMLEQKRYSGRRISLDFKEVEISDVLRLIADVSELNIIAGDEVKGEVTIRLVDVPWDQALDVILLTKGLGFVRVGNVLRIAPADLLKAEDEARLQERRAKEKLEDLLVKLQPVNYGNVKEIAKMVSKLLSARGTVDVDARTNTLIIKDINSVIDEATALVKAIDTQTPQVLIESKIVEANLDFSRELGSTWAFGAQPLVDGFDDGSGDRRDLGGNDVRFHDNPLLTDFTETFNHVSVSNPITSVANGLLDLGAFLLDEKLNVELRIEAAESNGEGKVISSPRVVTLDNRRATIEQGVSIPFQTFENGDAKLEFIDAVLKLDVTPHITADRSIIMKVEVQRNAPDDSVQTPTGSPAIAKNEATTETLVRDGQTLVIGGIYVVQKGQRSSSVPYLDEIPILGNAFKNNEVRDVRKELLVFVTPRIVVNPEVAS
jgi:type IV pilus assembly protein PilQ